MEAEIDKVVSIFGSQSGLARAVGVSDNAISKWVAKGCIPPGRAMSVYQLVADRKTPDGEMVSLESLLLESEIYKKNKKRK